jgi:short-subunit dehydrogenase
MTATPKGTALITGASSGIGAVYADRLARRGFDLVLVARNGDRLQALAARLTAETGRKIETIAADLTDKKDIARVEAAIRTNRELTLLVNNAGVGATAPLLASDIEKMEEMIAINVNALTRLTYAAVPGFVARGTGTLVLEERDYDPGMINRLRGTFSGTAATGNGHSISITEGSFSYTAP